MSQARNCYSVARFAAWEMIFLMIKYYFKLMFKSYIYSSVPIYCKTILTCNLHNYSIQLWSSLMSSVCWKRINGVMIGSNSYTDDKTNYKRFILLPLEISRHCKIRPYIKRRLHLITTYNYMKYDFTDKWQTKIFELEIDV